MPNDSSQPADSVQPSDTVQPTETPQTPDTPQETDSPQPSLMNKIISSLVLIAAVVLLGFGAEGAWTAYSESADWEHSEGKVIRVIRKTSTSGRRGRRVTNYTPIFRFTAKGEPFPRTITSDISTPVSFNVGEKVDVIYPADAPEKARINSPTQLYYTPGLLSFIGLILLAAGIGLRRKK